METNKDHIENHLSEQELKDYLAGYYSGKEMNKIERHLEYCPLCSDALSGLESMEPAIISEDLNDLNERLQSRISKKKPTITWSIRMAAALVLLAVSSYFIIQYNRQTGGTEKIARENSPEELKGDSLIATNTDSMKLSVDSLNSTTAIAEAREPQEQIARSTEPKNPVDVVEDNIESGSGVSAQQEPVPEETQDQEQDEMVLEIPKEETKKITVTEEQPVAAKPELKRSLANQVKPEQEEAVAPKLLKSDQKKTRSAQQKTEVMAQPSMDMIETEPLNSLIIDPVPNDSITSAAHPVDDPDDYNQAILSDLNYPEEASRAFITGMVTVEFQVDSLGKLSHFQIIKSLGSGCDEEAIRVIQIGPSWLPAKSGSSTISQVVRISIPFNPKN